MPAPIETLLAWLSPWLPAITVMATIMAILSMLAIPWLIVSMPEDYFISKHKPVITRSLSEQCLRLLRNTAAITIVCAGIIMLVLPGQGVLTILVGIGISTFPGKYRLERRMVRQPKVHQTLNWIRQRYNKPALVLPELADTE